MIRGLYTSASGMQAQQHRMDALSNNLANVDVNGYKRDQSVHKAFPQMLIRRMNDNGVFKFPLGSVDTMPVVGKLGSGVEYNESFTVFTQGSLKETGNPFDLALEGKGFFCVQTPHGERYTRNGSFVLGKEGYLLSKEGYPVLGEKGPIAIKKNNFTVDTRGRIFHNSSLAGNPRDVVSMEENEWESTDLVDVIKVVDFRESRFIKKQGSSLWKSTVESGEAFVLQGQERPRPGVRQNFLETSNVNPVREMVNMIEVNRAYESNQKTIQAHDSLLGKLINQAARYS